MSSNRNNLAERLILLTFKLIRRPHSRQELAREFGVDAKTVSRDLDALGKQFSVTEAKRGREIFYSLAESGGFAVPDFSLEELAVILLAQQAIAGIGITAAGTTYDLSARSLLGKVRQSLPVAIADRLDSLSNIYGSALVPAKNFARHTETIDRLVSAALRKKKVLINYYGLTADRREKRTVDPLAVYFDPDGATLKLAAFDEKRGREIVFSIDRIERVDEQPESFRRSAEFNLKNYLEVNCFNGIHGTPVTVRLRATGVTARIFAERQFHPSQTILDRKQKRGVSPETITIQMRVAGGRGLERFILSWLPDLEVIAPPELAVRVKQILTASLKNF